MLELNSTAPFDEATFRARAEKRAAERIDMQVERMKTRQRIFALLTPEQQEKAEIVFQNMGKRGPGHGPGMRD
jgi:Spy/CpxP family protein refolding chaperone